MDQELSCISINSLAAVIVSFVSCELSPDLCPMSTPLSPVDLTIAVQPLWAYLLLCSPTLIGFSALPPVSLGVSLNMLRSRLYTCGRPCTFYRDGPRKCTVPRLESLTKRRVDIWAALTKQKATGFNETVKHSLSSDHNYEDARPKRTVRCVPSTQPSDLQTEQKRSTTEE